MSGTVLHVAGIPAVGKSSFCRYLARKHGFAHYDLECWPRGWPAPHLKPMWDDSPREFVAQLRSIHQKVAIDWGFPVNSDVRVSELQAVGVRLIWFTGDFAHARKLYDERGGLALAAFDKQLRDIRARGYPKGLGAVVVTTLTRGGRLRRMHGIYEDLFSRK